MRLVVPAGDPLGIQAAPIYGVALESASQLEPLAVTRVGIASLRGCVHPLLERVDRCAVREKDDGAFEQPAPGSHRVGFGIKPAVLAVDVRRGEELHRHRRDLRHLGARVPLEQQRQLCGLEHVK